MERERASEDAMVPAGSPSYSFLAPVAIATEKHWEPP